MAAKAKQLIESRLKEMDDFGYDEYVDDEYVDDEYVDDEDMTEFHYTCMDTGMSFETYDEPAMYSPFTGSTNIMMNEETQQTSTPVPGSQKNQQQQTPLSANPAPGQPAQNPWSAQNSGSNPASDAQGSIGATQADGKGFVPYPQSVAPAPSFQSGKPGSM